MSCGPISQFLPVPYVHCNNIKRNTINKSHIKSLTLQNQPQKHYKTKRQIQSKSKQQSQIKLSQTKLVETNKTKTNTAKWPSPAVWGAREKQLDSGPTTIRARSQVRCCFLVCNVVLVCFSMFFSDDSMLPSSVVCSFFVCLSMLFGMWCNYFIFSMAFEYLFWGSKGGWLV